jgi:hypothetical protein
MAFGLFAKKVVKFERTYPLAEFMFFLIVRDDADLVPLMDSGSTPYDCTHST